MSNLVELGEYVLHGKIAAMLNGEIGERTVGDDAALLPLGDSGDVLLISTDRLAAGVPPDLRARLLTVQTLSDVVCMGGHPLGMVVALQVPRDENVDTVLQFLSEVEREAASYGCHLVGGDTKEGRELAIVGTAVAVAKRDQVVRRQGAVPGDIVAVTLTGHRLWGARWAFHLLRACDVPVSDATHQLLLDADRNFRFPFSEAMALAGHRLVTAGLDLSDGLGAGLHILARSSEVGIDIVTECISELVDPQASVVTDALGLPRAALAWSPGYMWENLYTIRPANWDRAVSEVAAVGGRLHRIGRTTSDGKLTLDGRPSEVFDAASDEKFRPWPWQDRTEHWRHRVEEGLRG